MNVSVNGEVVEYHSQRPSEPSAEFSATYAPVGSAFHAAAGTLEYFLTERYCLYHHDRSGVPYRLEIHHSPWSLQMAEAAVRTNRLAEANGLSSRRNTGAGAFRPSPGHDCVDADITCLT